MRPQAQHERLEVYSRALDVAARLEDVARGIPEHRADLRDQLRRASASIPLNIAEGAGEFSPADKTKFYRYARRSTSESMAILDLLERTTEQRNLGELRDELARIGGMLTMMVRTTERRRS